MLVLSCVVPCESTIDETEVGSEEEYREYMNDWFVHTDDSNGIIGSAYSDIQNKGSSDDMIVKKTSSSNGGLQNSSWPMSCHDTYHTSQSSISTADNPGTEKWRYKTLQDAGTVESGAIVDNNGIIYFGSMGADHKLYALYPNGTMKWYYKTPAAGIIWSTPTIADDGTVYVGDWNGRLSALDQNGSLLWQLYRSGEFASSPAIGDDGTIYLGHSGGCLYAINPDGSEKWHYETGYYVNSGPAVGMDGTIYIGSADNYIYALYPNGVIRWRYLTGGVIKGHPSIAPDNKIYVPSFDGNLYALNPNGTLIWKVSTGDEVAAASAAIATDGTLYVGTEVLRAFYPNGTLKWMVDVGGDVYGTSPAVSADGTIYVSAGVCIVAVNPDGTIKWKKLISNVAVLSSPCISEDGSIYVGSSWRNHDGTLTWGYLHAFGEAPLSVDAGGPYSGNAEQSISFMSTTFGGALPYTFQWEFGDGNTSNLEHPTHTYSRPGEYIATLTLVDGEGNSSSDTANVTVGTSLPTVRILRPENALYLFNKKIMPLKRPVIIGRITIKVEAFQEDVGIDHVSFYIDSGYKYSDYEAPYEWDWTDRSFSFYDIGVAAESKDGKWGGADIYNVLKIF
ncbi:MAG TPA: PQQ-binding-like beta-propeller repeat protein [Candidatus Thermoplasmatota archaeon]|nr:PQQ-binding-like beta-propeller repeat protein [Candidatus Thermoplasmatota archaeon]